MFGNAGRGLIRNDGRVNFDLSLSKNFRIDESKYFQFRGDFFNAFNHPDFTVPNSVLGSPAYGTITGATSPRSIQLVFASTSNQYRARSSRGVRSGAPF